MNKANWSELLVNAVNEAGVVSKAYSVFYDYSLGNQMLAYGQLSARGMNLSPIATYKKWQSLNRNVKKGEKAIALCMPLSFKKDGKDGEDDTFVRGFTYKNLWFSLDQTDGENFVQDEVTPEWNADKALFNLGVSQVGFKHIDGNVQGYATKDSIAINPVALYPHKTRFHELAHVVLGHTKETTLSDGDLTPANIAEVEAESVAYILCCLFGFSGQAESRNYIQGWLGHESISDKSAQKIFGAAEKILKAGK